MNNLMVKEVEFQTINMVACKTKEDEVFVGVKSICQGLGIAYNAQIERINRDDILPEGVRKIRIPTSSGEQEANMLNIEYLPFFLVGIKTSMCKGEIKPKLKEFKLKAKDALAKAFLKNNELMQLQNQIKQMIKNEVSKALSETAANEMEKVEEKCSEFYRPTHFTKYNISKYIKQRLGITKANEEYELVKQRIFIILQASSWQDIPMEVLSNSMHIIDESIDVIKKDRPYSQVSMFDYRQVPRARM